MAQQIMQNKRLFESETKNSVQEANKIHMMLLLAIRSFIKGRLSSSLSFVIKIKIINIEVWCKEKNAKI